MEEGNDLDPPKLVAFKFKEGTCCKELATLWWQKCRDVHKLIVVYAFCPIIWLTQVLLEKVPQVFEIFLLEDFGGLVLEEASASFLAHLEVEGVLGVRLLKEEFWDGFERRIALLL